MKTLKKRKTSFFVNAGSAIVTFLLWQVKKLGGFKTFFVLGGINSVYNGVFSIPIMIIDFLTFGLLTNIYLWLTGKTIELLKKEKKQRK
jgi:uncharacterized membrane protein (DUF485 family)